MLGHGVIVAHGSYTPIDTEHNRVPLPVVSWEILTSKLRLTPRSNLPASLTRASTPLVYRLGHEILNLKRAVQLCYGVPKKQKNVIAIKCLTKIPAYAIIYISSERRLTGSRSSTSTCETWVTLRRNMLSQNLFRTTRWRLLSVGRGPPENWTEQITWTDTFMKLTFY